MKAVDKGHTGIIKKSKIIDKTKVRWRCALEMEEIGALW
jgi:hypothetical protein